MSACPSDQVIQEGSMGVLFGRPLYAGLVISITTRLQHVKCIIYSGQGVRSGTSGEMNAFSALETRNEATH